ncbi:hypothetical protein [Ferrimonas balearica]|uniref:hypothetical protein n=1 Tax=Ferrimonas balearica TaxID=44012 RepID=UPI001F20960D|nr:hypothetical protein [Ferrimonas balearica]MBY6093833.1 hypothetical protein [Ferrimonas balearica]
MKGIRWLVKNLKKPHRAYKAPIASMRFALFTLSVIFILASFHPIDFFLGTLFGMAGTMWFGGIGHIKGITDSRVHHITVRRRIFAIKNEFIKEIMSNGSKQD